MILYDSNNITVDSANTPESVIMRAFKLYKLVFRGTGFKSVPLSIQDFEYDGIKKTVLMYGKVSQFGTKLELYIFPLTNPFPLVAVLAGVGILSALGLTLAILHQVDDMSGVAYATIATIGIGIYAFKLKK